MLLKTFKKTALVATALLTGAVNVASAADWRSPTGGLLVVRLMLLEN